MNDDEGFQTGPYGSSIKKDPAAVLSYGLGVKDWLQAGDTVATAVFTVPAGLTKLSEFVNIAPMTVKGVIHPIGSVALVRLSGGTAGESYLVTAHVTTALGDQDDRSFTVIIAER